MFNHGDTAFSRNRGGLGIGLTLVKRLVELHGGRVEATSAGPGLGSEFTIYSLIDGVVKFEHKSRTRYKVSVYPEPETSAA